MMKTIEMQRKLIIDQSERIQYLFSIMTKEQIEAYDAFILNRVVSQ